MPHLALLFLVALPAAAEAGLRGMVVDDAGQPLADATVLLAMNDEVNDTVSARRTGSDGRFAFPDWNLDGRPWVLIAHRPGLAIGCRIINPPGSRGYLHQEAAPPGELHVRVQPVKRRMLRVVDAKGAPVSGATVALSSLAHDGRAWVQARQVLGKQFSWTSGEDGTVVVDAVDGFSSAAVLVTTPEYGTQGFTLEGVQDTPTLALRPAAAVEGVVVADDPQAVRDLPIVVWSHVPLPSSSLREGVPAGHALVRTDSEGRFRLPAIMAGRLSLWPQVPPESKHMIRDLPSPTVASGETARVQIELARGVPARGRIVDDQSEKGVEGVRLFVYGRRCTTGADGTYTSIALPGALGFNISGVPPPWCPPFSRYQSAQMPEGAKEFELPTIRLSRGVPITGKVVDEEGRGVPYARVFAFWKATSGEVFTLQGTEGAADGEGNLRMEQIPGDVEVALTAQTADRATEAAVKLAPRQREPVQIVVVREAAAAFEGRIVDSSSGKPVAAARVRFRIRRRYPAGHAHGMSPMSFHGEDCLRTDEQGVYRTPVELARPEQYSLSIEADGYASTETGWLNSTAGDPARFDDVLLVRDARAEGVVVDHLGKPIGGATVWSWAHAPAGQALPVSAQTRADGTFRLEKLHPLASLVFADKEGYRLRGAAISADGEPLTITLPAADAPPEEPLRSYRTTARAKLERLRGLLLPIEGELDPRQLGYFLEDLVKRLGTFDRDFALGKLDGLQFDSARARVLLHLGEVDDALPFIAQQPDAENKSRLYLGVAGTAKDAARKREILAESLLAARGVTAPDRRAWLLAAVAERLFDAGDKAGAKKIMDEGLHTARQLEGSDWSGYARGTFAEVTALFDPPAAKELVEGLKDHYDKVRHAGNTAHELAAVNPAEAERFLALISRENRLSPYAARVCYRMAAVDVPRARRLVDAIPDTNNYRYYFARAQTLGAMAMGLAEKDPKQARELLAEAFAALPAPGVQSDNQPQAFGVAFALVGYAETVDPERTRDYFWRALALHPGPESRGWSTPQESQKWLDGNIATLVLLLGAYDQMPEVRKSLMNPVFERWSGPFTRQQFYGQDAVFAAMALTDPERTIDWHRAFFPRVSKDDRRLVPQPWQTVADVFGSDGRQLIPKLVENVLHLWTIDKEDL